MDGKNQNQSHGKTEFCYYFIRLTIFEIIMENALSPNKPIFGEVVQERNTLLNINMLVAYIHSVQLCDITSGRLHSSGKLL